MAARLPAPLALAPLLAAWPPLSGCGSPARDAPTAAPPQIAVSLDGLWASPDGPVRLPMPGWHEGPLRVWRDLSIPEAWAGAERAVLRADATGWLVTARVDGVEVAVDRAGLWPAALDLGGHLTPGRHRLELTVEPASPDNVVPGRHTRVVSFWTYNAPHAGTIAARGEIRLDLAPPRRIERLSASLRDGRLLVRAETTETPGQVVAFAVVRDGAEILAFPEATVDQDGVAEAGAAWTGPTWTPGGTGSPMLAHLVATLGNGATAGIRIGPRELRLDATGLAVGDRRTYLTAHRLVTANAFTARADLALAEAAAVAGGLNALDLHGELSPDALFRAADELGLPLVVTPRCIGQAHQDGAADASAPWAAFIAEGNRRIAAAYAQHPALVLWSVCGFAPPDGVADPQAALAEGGVPALGWTEAGGLAWPAAPRGPQPAALPRYLNELALPSAAADRAGAWLEALYRAHEPTGVGFALNAPGPPPAGDPAADVLRRHAAPRAAAHRRRGPALLEVALRRDGAPASGLLVTLETPRQPTLGAFSDEAGIAAFEQDYCGPAAVVVPGMSPQPVALRCGEYADGRWVPHAVRLALDLPPA